MIMVEDDVKVYDSFFALMANIDNDKDEKVTLLNIKENHKNYSLKEFKSLATVLIDTINDLTRDEECLKKDFEKCKEETVELSVQVTKL